ncbi:MAG TPA: hypothetical protein VFV48_07080 [Pseudomonadales bacterium]|nr:hypothetical protein [Pseudomonadales bacterium]
MDSHLNKADIRLRHEHETILTVWSVLRQTLLAKGFDDTMSVQTRRLSRYELRRDTLDDSESFYGEWRSANAQLEGTVLIHANGQVYAEFDVLKPHPTDKRWFVEAVTAWGRNNMLKSELKMMPAFDN